MGMKRIALTEIIGNPNQPRQESFGLETGELQELANSIQRRGLIQAITVRPIDAAEAAAAGTPDAKYMVIAGERRFRAHKLLAEQGATWSEATSNAGEPITSVLANVRRMTVEEMAVDAIIENARRKDVTPLEEARAYKAALDRGWTPEDLAREIGLKPGQSFRITDRIVLLNLRPEYQTLLKGNQITLDSAYYIAKLSPADQDAVMRKVTAGLTDVVAIRSLCQRLIDGAAQQDIFGKEAPKASEKDVAALSSMERRILSVATMVGQGWKDGECVVASKVDPDRVSVMADRIAEIRRALGIMERSLRTAKAQGEFGLAGAAEASEAAEAA